MAVHGLNGHPENTFTAANGICWLRSLLPALAPNIRVLSYGYDARTHSSSLLSRENLHDHAEQLIEELRRERAITEVNIHEKLEDNSILPEAFKFHPQKSRFPICHRDSLCGALVVPCASASPGPGFCGPAWHGSVPE